MKKIALEEHFSTEAHMSCLRSRTGYPRIETIEDEKHNKVERILRSEVSAMVVSPKLIESLLDLGPGRISEMDEAGIDMQVLCTAGPSVEEFDVETGTAMAQEVNDEVARAIDSYPERFAGFATLMLKDPHAAAVELERAVRKLGLKGAKINSHVGGEYLDDRKYWEVFEVAEKLGVPIYLHPKEPGPDMVKPYAVYPELLTAMWGFAADTGLHAMRLICSGLFDTHPGLKIILGHLGEAIPFWLWRIDNHWAKRRARGSHNMKFKRKPSDYFKDNFFVTTSGMFCQRALQNTYMTLGADRILFAVDYPWESNEEAVRFIEDAPICDDDKEKICHLNAEKLLGL